VAGSGGIDGKTLTDLLGPIIQAPHVALWVKDRDLRYVHVSPAWEAKAGLSRDIVLGRRDDEFRPAELADRFQARDRKIMETGIAETHEERHETADGVRSYVFTKFPLVLPDGTVAGIAGVSSDTSDFRSDAGLARAGLPVSETVLDSLLEPVFRFGADYVLTYANAAFQTIYDRWSYRAAGQALDDLFAADFSAAFKAASRSLSPSSPSTSFEREAGHFDGRPRWRNWRLDGTFDPSGRLAEVQAVGSDITDQKAYQGALETLLEAVGRSDARVSDVLGMVLNVGCDYFDLESADIVRLTPDGPRLDHHRGGPPPPPDVVAALATVPMRPTEPTAIQDALRVEPSCPGIGTFIAQRIDIGREIWGLVVFRGRWPRQTPYSRYALTFMNVVARWIAVVIDRSDRLAEISRGRTELSLILDNVPAQVVMIGPGGCELMSNAAARTAPRPDASRATDLATLAAGDARTSRLERWEDVDGAVRWMQTERVVFKDAATGEPRLLVVSNDVTGTVLKEQALAKVNEGLTQFAYIASHDLQEPLRKIGTFVDILVEGVASGNTDDVDYATRVVKESARRARSLIKDLLAWSRLSNRPLELAPLRFAGVVRDVLADLLAGRPGSESEVVDAMDDVIVPADETQVRQLVENLLTNALKYRHPDRPGRIVLRLHRAGRRQCLFEVEDNGIGFDPIHASQIFEPFRRLHSERDYSGTGVGLAICARVCEQHGWTIRGYGRPGAGATFRVSMTVETDAAGADAGPPVP
jgi:PAS domain S-box-containing protein